MHSLNGARYLEDDSQSDLLTFYRTAHAYRMVTYPISESS